MGRMTKATVMVPVDSKHPYHASMFKTLVLLRLYDASGEPVFFVVEGCETHTVGAQLDDSYFYEEHTCPTNFIPIEAVMTAEDSDPHGVFDYVRSVWMPSEYAEDNADTDAIIRQLFPEISAGRRALAEKGE